MSSNPPKPPAYSPPGITIPLEVTIRPTGFPGNQAGSYLSQAGSYLSGQGPTVIQNQAPDGPSKF